MNWKEVKEELVTIIMLVGIAMGGWLGLKFLFSFFE